MAQIFDIREVTVGPRNFDAVVVLAPDAPLTTDEDPQGTALVRDLLPGLQDHVCLGDSSEKFGEVMDQTELAHLLEHVTVELLALTDIAGDVSTGRTAPVEGEERAYDITLACPDDVLVASALSSAVWILQWAYTGGGEPVPDVDAIVSGIVGLVQSLPEPEPMPQPEPEVVETVEPPVEESAEACADEPADVAAGATAPMPEPQVVAYEPAAAAAPAAESASAAEPEPVDPDATVFSPMMAQMVADQLGAQDLDEPEPVAPGGRGPRRSRRGPRARGGRQARCRRGPTRDVRARCRGRRRYRDRRRRRAREGGPPGLCRLGHAQRPACPSGALMGRVRKIFCREGLRNPRTGVYEMHRCARRRTSADRRFL